MGERRGVSPPVDAGERRGVSPPVDAGERRGVSPPVLRLYRRAHAAPLAWAISTRLSGESVRLRARMPG